MAPDKAEFKAKLGCALFVCVKFQAPDKAEFKAKLGLIKDKFRLKFNSNSAKNNKNLQIFILQKFFTNFCRSFTIRSWGGGGIIM